MIKKFNQMNESADRIAELKAHRAWLLKEIEEIDSEIEELINTTVGDDPIARLKAWLDRPSHKNKRTYLPSGLIGMWLDKYVFRDNMGDPDMWPKHSTESLVDIVSEYGAVGPNEFVLGENGITKELIDDIINQDFDKFKIDW